MQTLIRPKGNLDLLNFTQIIDKLSSNLIYLTLYFQGEPLLNPHFTEMVTSARNEKDVRRIVPELLKLGAEGIIEYQLNKII
jgi:wyosine [tRNA(Phe)-imidazoG37] synthetase (radical SAM superfamily)